MDVPGQAASYWYPNQQEATALFYHDHAMGITRLNAAAGLMGLYLIRDEFEDKLRLPSGAYEVPLVLFDRSFHKNGQIFYPVSTKPEAPWVSEYYGSAILANAKIFPYLEVERRKYRFRLLNASNGSFYRLSISTAATPTSPAMDFVLPGSEQGFLAAPQKINLLILGPGERADILVDFAESAGKELFLHTDVALILQFCVGAKKAADSSVVPANLRPMRRLSENEATVKRDLTLADYQDRLGRSSVMLLNGAHWSMPVTEKPVVNSTEIWSFLNLTDDSHPIHLHLVRFLVLDRRPFDLATYQLRRLFTPVPL